MSTYYGTLLARNLWHLILLISLGIYVIGFPKTNKVFVDFLNKFASKTEIAEVFFTINL